MAYEIALVLFYIGIAFIFTFISIKIAPMSKNFKGLDVNVSKYIQLFFLGLAILMLLIGFSANKDIITNNNSTLSSTSYDSLITFTSYGSLINVLLIFGIIIAMFLLAIVDIIKSFNFKKAHKGSEGYDEY